MKILTNDGFKNFTGIMRKQAECLRITIMGEGYARELEGSIDHRIKIVDRMNGEVVWRELKDVCTGDIVYTGVGEKVGLLKIVKIEGIGRNLVYSPVDVDGMEYKSGVVDNHNCSFLGSSETLIEGDVLDKMVSRDPVSWKYGYDMNVYEEPVEGAMYVMGVDSAMGNAGDYSAVQVLRIEGKKKFRQVAMYRRNTIRAEDFAVVVNDICRWYNDAQYIIENNGVGQSVAEELFYEIGNDCMISTDKRGALGTKATKETKLDACRLLKKMLEKGHLTVVDSDTIDELSRFEEVAPDVFRGAPGKHDDLVSALYWACYCLQQPEVDLDGFTSGTSRRSMGAAMNDEMPPPMYMTDGGMNLETSFGADFWAGLN